MDRYNESITEIETHQTTAHVIDYSGLLETVQLSAARLIDVRGSLEATSFSELLSTHDKEDHERIMHEVGSRFDDALLSFVTATLIARHHERVVIRAEASEGIDGYLPWQPKLEERVQTLQSHGLLEGVQVEVQRYIATDTETEPLIRREQALAA